MSKPAPSKKKKNKRVNWRLDLTPREASDYRNTTAECGCGERYPLTHGPRCPSCDTD